MVCTVSLICINGNMFTRCVPEFEIGAISANGKQVSEPFHPQVTSWTHWPCLGLLGTCNQRVFGELDRRAAFMEAHNTTWVAKALGRTMPEEYPGRHSLMALDICSDWASQAGLMIRLFLLSNNFALSDTGSQYDSPHHTQIAALVEQITSTGSKNLQCFFSAQGPVSEAIRAKIFVWALQSGRDDIVHLLLSLHGCDGPEIADAYLHTAAFIQDKRASARMIRTLLEHGAAKTENSSVHSALDIAIAAHNQAAIAMLLETGACLRLSSLEAAIRAGNSEMVRLVLNTGVDINAKIPLSILSGFGGFVEWAALPHAADRGHLQIVEILVARGADVHAVHEWSKFWSVHYSPLLWTTALGIAVAAEQVDTVRFLAHKTRRWILGGAPNGSNLFCSPLGIACLTGNTEIIMLLLLLPRPYSNSSGDDVCSVDDDISATLGMRINPGKFGSCFRPETLLELLIMSVETGSEEQQLVKICEILAIRGARIDRALINAAEREMNAVAKLLLRFGPSLGNLPGTRATAFGVAIEMGNLKLAQILYRAGATETGYLRIVKGAEMAEFLDGVGLLDVILRDYGWCILSQALEEGEESRWLTDRILSRTDLDFRGKHSCILAAVLTHTLDVDFVSAMIDRGAISTKFEVRHAIEAAIKADAPDDIMRLLFSEFARVTGSRTLSADSMDCSISILICVARYGSRRSLSITLEAINWEPEDLGTALNHSIYHANYRIIQDLIDAGASLTRRNEFRDSPLEAAVGKEQEWLVKMLLAAGANVGDPRALAKATTLGNIRLVELLLREGSDPTGDSSSALQIASYKGFLGIARVLIDAGADVNAPGRIYDDADFEQNGLEMTALTLASLEARLETMHLLLSRGAAVHGAARGKYIDAVRAASLYSHKGAVTLLKSFGGWTESDERSLKAKRAAAIAAMKAHWESRRASDEANLRWSSDSQGCDIEDKTPSTELVCLGPGTETQDSSWPRSWEDELVWADADATMRTEFDDFFLAELSRFHGWV